MRTWRSLLLLALAAPMLMLAGALIGALLLFVPWPPPDPLVDLRAWLIVAGLITGAALLAVLAVRPRKPHGPWLKAGMLPYPMNDEG